MSKDTQSGPGSPFDSFAGRLKKAMKKKGGSPGDQTPEAAPPPAEPAKDPAQDSFTGRLGKLMKPDAAPSPAEPDSSEESEVSPFDSFSGRLGKQLEKTVEASDESAEPPPDDETAVESTQPVGTGEYVVKQGDCIASIAQDKGHLWETIWNDPANVDVREARKDPSVLLPEDRLHVPPLREKWETRPTEQRHRFRRKGFPEIFRVRLLRDGEPRGNLEYRISVDGVESNGVSDANGNVACAIAPNARRAILEIGAPPDVERYEFTLGAIDPIDSNTGVQNRLNNLGFDCGAVDGIVGSRTEAALREYQRSRRLPVTGEPDEATRKQLQSDYGC